MVAGSSDFRTHDHRLADESRDKAASQEDGHHHDHSRDEPDADFWNVSGPVKDYLRHRRGRRGVPYLELPFSTPRAFGKSYRVSLLLNALFEVPLKEVFGSSPSVAQHDVAAEEMNLTRVNL